MSHRRRDRGLRIAMIGAGLGGVACAVNLSRAGFTNFTVFESAAGPGGVWWHNTYPGCAVDVNSQAYSYSFMPYVWRRTHATQPEVRQYVDDVIDHFQVRDRFQFGTAVHQVRWQEDAHVYFLDTSNGEAGPFDIVVSCVGMLSKPAFPSWSVGTEFRGPVFHTAQFDHGLDLAGKTVALVGTGSTACQLAPMLAARAGRLQVYQREPGYVLPKRAREFSAAEQARFRRHPFTQKLDRWRLLRQASKDVQAFDVTSPKQEKMRRYHARYLSEQVDDPVVRAALLPSYPYGCKRPVFASDFYETFNRPNVELVPEAVERLSADGVIDGEGVSRPADVVILATGFQATNYLSDMKVFGRDGRELHDVWADAPYAFLGMTVPGFPNFFMLYGPNTNGGWSICAQLERQSELVVRMAVKLSRQQGGSVEARPAATQRYDQWIQQANHRRRSAFEGGCHNYYHSATGKNVTQWPYGHMVYALVTRLLPALGLVVSRGRAASTEERSG